MLLTVLATTVVIVSDPTCMKCSRTKSLLTVVDIIGNVKSRWTSPTTYAGVSRAAPSSAVCHAYMEDSVAVQHLCNVSYVIVDIGVWITLITS